MFSSKYRNDVKNIIRSTSNSLVEYEMFLEKEEIVLLAFRSAQVSLPFLIKLKWRLKKRGYYVREESNSLGIRILIIMKK